MKTKLLSICGWFLSIALPVFASAQTHKDLVVHEWGTFTSVFGSDGIPLSGMEVEEPGGELPGFVYGHDRQFGRPQASSDKLAPKEGETETKAPEVIRILQKGMRPRPFKGATVRMETPVLYFYTAETLAMRVGVKFNGGTISEWYPARAAGETLPSFVLNKGSKSRPFLGYRYEDAKSGGLDFTKSYQGQIQWDIQVSPPTADRDFIVQKPGENRVWLHPRAPRSNLIRTPRGETESYLFYRGLGNFEQPINFSVTDDAISITASTEIPFYLVFHRQLGRSEVLATGSVSPSQGAKVLLPQGDTLPPNAQAPKGLPSDFSAPLKASAGQLQAYLALKSALTDAGLFEDEAAAMLRTWRDSYFEQDGLRVFWIVPRDFTDQILPIKLSVEPKNLERVLVGRSEILTPKFETFIAEEYSKPIEDNHFWNHRYCRAFYDRFEKLKALTASR